MPQISYSPDFINNRKMAVMLPVFVVPFLAVIFFLFGGGTPATDAPLPPTGLNTEVPKPADGEAIDSKTEAYQLADQEKENLERLRTLEDYAGQNTTNGALMGEQASGLALAPAPRAERSRDTAYDELSHKVNGFYQPMDYHGSLTDQKLDRLIALMEQEQSGSLLDVNREITRNPYLKYLERELTSGEFAGEKPAPLPDTTRQRPRRQTQEVAGYQRRVVQKLPQRRQGSRPAARQQGNAFYTMGGTTSAEKSNTISAVIHQDQTLVEGSTVKMRLLSDINLKGTIVPRNSFIYGVAAVRNERLIITIENVRYGKEILPVDLKVYDTDGMLGVYIPGSVDRETGKETLAGMSRSGGGAYNVTMSSGVKEQLTMQAAQTGIDGIKSLASQKARAVKVHVKANYRLYLKS